jgi:hypothetical protein
MKSLTISALLVSLVALTGLFATTGAAHATNVTVNISLVGEARVGEPVEVVLDLRSADQGVPIQGSTVTFLTDATFAGVEGNLELGKAITDENGIATLTYKPRFASAHDLRVEYLLPGESEPGVFSETIIVSDNGLQLHRSESGIRIPGLGAWLIITLVATVWAILLTVALRVIAIARAGDEAWPPHGGR